MIRNTLSSANPRESLGDNHTTLVTQFRNILDLRWKEFDAAVSQEAGALASLRSAHPDYQNAKNQFDAMRLQLDQIHTDAELGKLQPELNQLVAWLEGYLHQLSPNEDHKGYNQVLQTIRRDLEHLKQEILRSSADQNLLDTQKEGSDISTYVHTTPAGAGNTVDTRHDLMSGTSLEMNPKEMLDASLQQGIQELNQEFGDFQAHPLEYTKRLFDVENRVYEGVENAVKNIYSGDMMEKMSAKILLWIVGVIAPLVGITDIKERASQQLAKLQQGTSSETSDENHDASHPTEAVSPSPSPSPGAENPASIASSQEAEKQHETKLLGGTMLMNMLVSNRNTNRDGTANNVALLLKSRPLLDMKVSDLLQGYTYDPKKDAGTYSTNHLPVETRQALQHFIQPPQSLEALDHALGYLAHQYTRQDNAFRKYISQQLGQKQDITIRESLIAFSQEMGKLVSWTKIGNDSLNIQEIFSSLTSSLAGSWDYDNNRLIGPLSEFESLKNVSPNVLKSIILTSTVISTPDPHAIAMIDGLETMEDKEEYTKILNFGYTIKQTILSEPKLHLGNAREVGNALDMNFKTHHALGLYAMLNGETDYAKMSTIEKTTLLIMLADILGENGYDEIAGQYHVRLVGSAMGTLVDLPWSQEDMIDPEVKDFLAGMGDVFLQKMKHGMLDTMAYLGGAAKDQPVAAAIMLAAIWKLPLFSKRTNIAGIASGR